MSPLDVAIVTASGALVIYVVAKEIKRRVYLARRRENVPQAACDPVRKPARRSSPSEVPASLERDAI